MHIRDFLRQYRFLILAGIIPLILNFYFLFYKDAKTIEDTFEAKNIAVTTEFKRNIEHYLEKKIALSQLLLDLDEVKAGEFDKAKTILDKTVVSGLGIRSIFFYDSKGYVVSFHYNPLTASDLGLLTPEEVARLNIFDRQYFQDAIEGYIHISDITISRLTSASFITVALPWKDMNGNIQGIFALALCDEYLNNLYPKNPFENNTYKALMDGNGLPIIHPIKEYMITNQLFFSIPHHLGVTKVSSIHPSIIDQEKRLFTYLPVNGTSWYVMLVQPYSDIKDLLVQKFLVNGLITLLLIASISFFIYRYFKEQQDKKLLELVKQERLTSLTEIAASVAHEIRNPLVAIKGFIQLEELKPYTTLGTSTTIILEEIKNVETIITEFLALSKNLEIQFVDFDLSKKINDLALLMASHALMNDITFTNTIEEGVFIEGDIKLIQQGVLNILKNSFEAVGEGGLVDLTLQEKEGWVEIKVTDNGPGIPPEIIKKLGTPFNTQKENGTGLGLAICKKVVDMHNGYLKVTSNKEGTIIIIYLPLSQG